MDQPQSADRAQVLLHRSLELIVNQTIDHTSLHRTAKYFMDNGRAQTHAAAMTMLEGFGLTVCVGKEISYSIAHQTALLTLVNVARRTLLGGIEVYGLPDCGSISPLATDRKLVDVVCELGGIPVSNTRPDWPTAIIGDADGVASTAPSWRVTWEGWRGGVIPTKTGDRLSETGTNSLSPVLASAVCAAEAFSYHAGDHPLAGRRAAGLSLWRPEADWLIPDASEKALLYLPSRLWIIGLGNLGQAFAWLLASLPFEMRSDVQFVLQDYDRIALSNDSTSMLSFKQDIGTMKTRMVAAWLDARGFTTFIEERRFGAWTRRMVDEPGAALCGVDNAHARVALDQAGFDLIVEAGLGGGPQGFRSISIHTFPASRTPSEIWSSQVAPKDPNFANMPAYQSLKAGGMDGCGLTLLASRTVGVPFVGLIAGCLAIAELLRRLNGGVALEFLSGSTAALSDVELGEIGAPPYAHGYVNASER